MTKLQAIKSFFGEHGESPRPDGMIRRGDTFRAASEDRRRYLLRTGLAVENGAAGHATKPKGRPGNKQKPSPATKSRATAPLDADAAARKKAEAAAKRAAKKAAAQTGSPTGAASAPSSSEAGPQSDGKPGLQGSTPASEELL